MAPRAVGSARNDAVNSLMALRLAPITPRISIVVPILNEAAGLPGFLDHLRPLLARGEAAEVIIVDGGSTDGSPDIVRAPFRLIRAPRGRARQMNAGAACASGNALLFLHADCRLEARALVELRRTLVGGRVVGGAFRHVIADPHPFLRLIELGIILRAALARLFYGDQGIFCRRDVFAAIGGWPPIALMEEFPFCRALRRAGPVRLLRSKCISHARRWRARGIYRTTLRNWLYVLRYGLGTGPDRLARSYRQVREPLHPC